MSPQGLLGALPHAVLGDALFSDTSFSTTLLQLIEDYLCCKVASDVASGMSLLSTILSKFPCLRSSPEMSRYGMLEFVAFHRRRASDQLDGLSRQLTEESNASTGAARSRARARGVVSCPKGHTAVLHVTRHSSFRCDLCGAGVDRGVTMMGCRQVSSDTARPPTHRHTHTCMIHKQTCAHLFASFLPQ